MPNRFAGFRYIVEIDGGPRAAFGRCTGLHDGHQPVNYYIGDDEIDLRDVADPAHHATLTFIQGVMLEGNISAWQPSGVPAHSELRSGHITEYDHLGRAIAHYHFNAEWPTFFQEIKVVGGSDRQIDSLELDCEELDVD